MSYSRFRNAKIHKAYFGNTFESAGVHGYTISSLYDHNYFLFHFEWRFSERAGQQAVHTHAVYSRRIKTWYIFILCTVSLSRSGDCCNCTQMWTKTTTPRPYCNQSLKNLTRTHLYLVVGVIYSYCASLKCPRHYFLDLIDTLLPGFVVIPVSLAQYFHSCPCQF